MISRTLVASRMSTSSTLKPATWSPFHSRMRAWPNKPEAPKMITRMVFDFPQLGEGLGLAQSNTALVFRRYDWLAFQFPVNLQVRIVPRQSALVLRSVVIGGFIEDVSLVRSHAESVGKARRYPQDAPVVAGQANGFPFAKRWRTVAQVHGNIEDLAFHHPHQFALRMLDLVMQPAQDIALRTGMIVLHKPILDAQVRQGALVVAFQEESAPVAEHARLEKHQARQRSRAFLERIHRRFHHGSCTHQNTFSVKSCSRYAP